MDLGEEIAWESLLNWPIWSVLATEGPDIADASRLRHEVQHQSGSESSGIPYLLWTLITRFFQKCVNGLFFAFP